MELLELFERIGNCVTVTSVFCCFALVASIIGNLFMPHIKESEILWYKEENERLKKDNEQLKNKIVGLK